MKKHPRVAYRWVPTNWEPIFTYYAVSLREIVADSLTLDIGVRAYHAQRPLSDEEADIATSKFAQLTRMTQDEARTLLFQQPQ